jgi:hypothetical protein
MKEQTEVRIGWVLFDAKEFDVSTPLSLGNGRRVKFPKIEIRIFQKIENSTFRPPLLSLYCIEVETLLFKNVFFLPHMLKNFNFPDGFALCSDVR